ncbi:hypothetical protein TNCV_1586151 [Trichonephila clavipes]|nr:hypothetical protein TNCV_1586151 [Trichonephila clavipes]
MFPDHHLSTQAQLLPSTSSIPTAYPESQPPIPTSNDALPNNSLPLLNIFLNHTNSPRPSPLFKHSLCILINTGYQENLKSPIKEKKKELLKKNERSSI